MHLFLYYYVLFVVIFGVSSRINYVSLHKSQSDCTEQGVYTWFDMESLSNYICSNQMYYECLSKRIKGMTMESTWYMAKKLCSALQAPNANKVFGCMDKELFDYDDDNISSFAIGEYALRWLSSDIAMQYVENCSNTTYREVDKRVKRHYIGKCGMLAGDLLNMRFAAALVAFRDCRARYNKVRCKHAAAPQECQDFVSWKLPSESLPGTSGDVIPIPLDNEF